MGLSARLILILAFVCQSLFAMAARDCRPGQESSRFTAAVSETAMPCCCEPQSAGNQPGSAAAGCCCQAGQQRGPVAPAPEDKIQSPERLLALPPSLGLNCLLPAEPQKLSASVAGTRRSPTNRSAQSLLCVWLT